MSATSQGTNVMVQGRIVWTSGDLFQGKVKTDENTRQPIIDQRTGQPKKEYGFGLAVPKSNIQEVWAAMHQEAQAMYQGRQVPPNFSFKFKDGDGVDHNGIPFAQREGHAGCLVLACTTSLPIKFFRFDSQTNQNIQINEGIKCGDYVNVQLSVKAHPAIGQGKPGLYLNPNAVQFLGFGKEIVNTPSGDQLFGTQAPPLPPGASATPVAQPGMLVPSGMPQAQQFGPPPTQAAPHYGVLPPVHQPQNQQVPQMPPIPGTPGMPQQQFAPPSPMAAQQTYQPPQAAQAMMPQPQQYGATAPVPGAPGPTAPQQAGYPQQQMNNGAAFGGMPTPGFPLPGGHGGMPQYRQ